MIDWRSQVVSLKPAAVAVGKIFDVNTIWLPGIFGLLTETGFSLKTEAGEDLLP